MAKKLGYPATPKGWRRTKRGISRRLRGWWLEVELDVDNPGQYLWTATVPEGDLGECGDEETMNDAAKAAERVVFDSES